MANIIEFPQLAGGPADPNVDLVLQQLRARGYDADRASAAEIVRGIAAAKARRERKEGEGWTDQELRDELAGVVLEGLLSAPTIGANERTGAVDDSRVAKLAIDNSRVAKLAIDVHRRMLRDLGPRLRLVPARASTEGGHAANR